MAWAGMASRVAMASRTAPTRVTDPPREMFILMSIVYLLVVRRALIQPAGINSLCPGSKMLLGGAIVFIGGAEDQDRSRVGCPSIPPAMREMGLEEKAVTRAEGIFLPGDQVS